MTTCSELEFPVARLLVSVGPSFLSGVREHPVEAVEHLAYGDRLADKRIKS